MAELLYLDTARLGRMSPAAQQAHRDFAALAGEEGGSLYFEQFLAGGAADRPIAFQSRYPGLASWHGVAGLKRALRAHAGSPADFPVLLANRSAQLIKLAARLLFLTCRNVLTVDAGWPPYHDALAAERDRVGRRTTTVPVRREVFDGRETAGELIDRIVRSYRQNHCDGLFLPAVSHDGIRLPVEPIVRRIESEGELRFVVVDGAQAFCHVPTNLGRGYCDLFLAGCHKWLGSYLPMGVGFYGRLRSRQVVDAEASRMLATGELDDPLLRFTTQLEEGRLDGTTETVSLAALFTTHATASGFTLEGDGILEVLRSRITNVREVASAAPSSGWHPVGLNESLGSGILLLRQGRREVTATDPAAVRARFHEAGVALTAYADGTVRLAMPAEPLDAEALDRLEQAFRLAA